MAVKNKLGGQVPIIFKALTVTTEEGAAHDELYTDYVRLFANVIMKNSLRNISDDQLQMTTVYVFSSIRAYNGFNPDKSMLIRYKGVDLAIDTIVLDETKLPHYYTITALTNG